ncbi:MAG: FecR domain-containing protein, partial [Planctomycetota bacterium]
MTSNDKNMLELSELLLRSLDETITNEQTVELEKRLADDPAAIRYYVQFLRICSSLSKHSNIDIADIISSRISQNAKDVISWKKLAEHEKNGEAIEVERDDEKIETVLTKAEQEVKIRAFVREQKAMEDEERRLAEEVRRRLNERKLHRQKRIAGIRKVTTNVRQFVRIGATAAMLMVIGYLVYVMILPVPSAYVATLTDGTDIKWADPRQPTKLGSPLKRGSMKLEEGFAQITFNDSGQIILEAPAEINLECDNRVYLLLGKLVAEIPIQGRGFKINTPSASIIDLGTEVSVYVTENGSSDIYVFEGKVSLL